MANTSWAPIGWAYTRNSMLIPMQLEGFKSIDAWAPIGYGYNRCGNLVRIRGTSNWVTYRHNPCHE